MMLAGLALAFACQSHAKKEAATPGAGSSEPEAKTEQDLSGYQKAYFASGCFWCVEAIFESVKGVQEAVSGYAGGTEENPTYEQVGMGQTSHAEAVVVYYDPEEVSYYDLVRVFFGSHDPTTLNRQGADRGTQYRSVIFFHDAGQQQTARDVVGRVQAYFDDPIVTEITPLSNFHPAEAEHFDYYNRHPEQGYCRVVIDPKVKKLREGFAHLLKDHAG